MRAPFVCLLLIFCLLKKGRHNFINNTVPVFLQYKKNQMKAEVKELGADSLKRGNVNELRIYSRVKE